MTSIRGFGDHAIALHFLDEMLIRPLGSTSSNTEIFSGTKFRRKPPESILEVNIHLIG